jgi:hypothetical protein
VLAVESIYLNKIQNLTLIVAGLLSTKPYT